MTQNLIDSFTDALKELNVTDQVIDTAIGHTTRDDTSLPEALYRNGVDVSIITQALQLSGNGRFILAPEPPQQEALQLLPPNEARKYGIAPYTYDPVTRTATILTQNLLSPAELEEIKRITGVAVLHTAQTVKSALSQTQAAYATDSTSVEEPEDTVDRASLIPETIARRYNIVGLRKEHNTLIVAASETASPNLAEDLRFTLGTSVRLERRVAHEVTNLLQQTYGETTKRDSTNLDPNQAQVAQATEEENLAIREVNNMIRKALTIGASDIHIDPTENNTHIMLRLDGERIPHMRVPRSLHASLVARVKVLASMDVANNLKHQDGRIRIRDHTLDADLRVATQPTIHGEKVTMRILQSEQNIPTLEQLGMSPHVFNSFKQLFHLPQGLIFIAGPTGSGKSSTLFTFLKQVHTPAKNTMTIEDPIEYELHGINQSQINDQAGVSFASALRAFVRHDPDIILVGETRDSITAQLATEAALTGHLVLSTIHTNDAPSTVTRIIEMGVEPYLLSDALEAVLSQRLVRKICLNCIEPYEPDDNILAALGIPREELDGIELKHGRGCEECANTGYKGRTAVHEIMMITPAIEELILKRSGRGEIAARAYREGTRSLRYDALQKAYQGITTLDEALKRTTHY